MATKKSMYRSSTDFSPQLKKNTNINVIIIPNKTLFNFFQESSESSHACLFIQASSWSGESISFNKMSISVAVQW